MRVWRGHQDSAIEDLSPKGKAKENRFRRCVAVGELPAEGFCVAHPSRPELACELEWKLCNGAWWRNESGDSHRSAVQSQNR